MHDNSPLRRILLSSPLTLLVFAVLPGLFVAGRVLHLQLPIRFTTGMLLANVICLAVLVAVRWLCYLSGLRRGIRYGAGSGKPSDARELEVSAALVRTDLEKAGYCFAGDGSYAEKADLGYLGSALVYGGLLLLLATGAWDNLSQFSGTFLQGLGKPAQLSNRNLYYPVAAGPFSRIAGLPKLQVSQLNFTDKQHPKGTAEIVLWSKDKPVATPVLAVGEDSCYYRGYDIFLGRLLVDAGLLVKPKDDHEGVIIFKDAVKLSPLWKKDGDYSFYGTFTDRSSYDGELYYSPEKNLFRVKLAKKGKNVLDTVYPFQSVLHQVVGDYDLSFVGIGRWAELHVVYHRHMFLILAGGGVAVLGLVMRLFFRRQRVWLEEGGAGCRVRTVGAATKKLVQCTKAS